jgi:serine/threonine-protein kinase
MVPHPQKASSLVGKTIADKYQLSKVLGVGGMGVVYEALHTVTLRRVAVKVIHSWAIGGGAAATRFLREAQAAAQIRHPAIVDVLDAGQLPTGQSYLVFELLEGVDLETLIATRGLKVDDLIEIIAHVLDALAAAHERGFIHRDIKPANIFIAKRRAGDREVKLLDFGMAKRFEQSGHNPVTSHGTIVGTPDYMSPEQAVGLTIDARSDLWSVGVVLFRALAGRTPFPGTKPYEVLDQIVRARIPSLRALRPDLPEDLADVVDRCLSREVGARWQTAVELRDALAACVLATSHDDVLAAPTPDLSATPRSGEAFEHLEPTEIARLNSQPDKTQIDLLGERGASAIRVAFAELTERAESATDVPGERFAAQPADDPASTGAHGLEPSKLYPPSLPPFDAPRVRQVSRLFDPGDRTMRLLLLSLFGLLLVALGLYGAIVFSR